MATPVAAASGRFELRQQLGASATATVWRAYDRHRRQEVCLKLLHPQLLRDREARRRVAAEARAAGRLRHQNIVRPLESEISADAAALVFPLVEGETLAVRLARSGRLPAPDAAAIAAEIADALAYAHGRGVVHRDVKPGNIILGSDGRARLLDFGIAASLGGAAASPSTSEPITSGTLPYIAPEQLAGGAAQPASDVFSLGVVLYQMLAGRPPFSATTPAGVAAEHARQPPPISAAPPALLALTLLMLSPQPEARPSASAVADGLRDWQRDSAEAATVVGATVHGLTPVGATAVMPVPPPVRAGQRVSRARPRPWGAVAMGLVAATAIGLVALGSQLGAGLATLPAPSVTPSASAIPTPLVQPPKPNPHPGGHKGHDKHGH